MRHPKALSLLCLSAFALPALAGAQQHPLLERGFSPEKMYQFDQIDSVNLLNGNVSLNIPLGLRYPVSTGFSYGFTLTYNSKIWDVKEQSGESFGEAIPNRGSNAGFGWSISFGRLLDPDDPDNDFDPNDWVYESPDGAQHVFYERLNRHAADTPSDPANLYQYTRDGTYLRMRALSTTERRIDFPDGMVHRFDRYAPDKWRLTSMTDAFGNSVSFDYTTEVNTWRLTDSQGRLHKVVFQGDPAGWYSQLVQELRLQAPGGGTAVYSFNYAATVIPRSCLDTWPYNSTTVTVPRLLSVTLPDESAWVPEHYTTNPDSCYAHGAIKALTLPTLGKIEWTYGYYELPLYPCTGTYWFETSAGVKTRRFLGAAGENPGLWTYTPALSAPPPNSGNFKCESQDDFPYEPASEQLSNTVVTPLKDKIVHYFSVYPGATGDLGSPFSPYEYALPLSRKFNDGNSRFLSTQVFDCNELTGSCPPTPQRSTYLRYEHDASLATFPCTSTSTVGKGCLDTQRRVVSESTIFHDDGGRISDLNRSEFDGLGHYRYEQRGVNFDTSGLRTEFTDFNSANGTYALDANGNPASGYSFTMVPTNAPWVLGIYGFGWATEAGATAALTQAVDPNTGWVSRRRIHSLNDGGDSNQDVLQELEHTGGNLTSERYYGGDTQWVPMGNIHSIALPQPPSHRIDHTYEFGALTTSQYKDANNQALGSLNFFALQQTIDRWTGLVASSTDTAGVRTELTYDLQGRLLFARPPAGEAGRGGQTQIVYTRATGTQPAQAQVYRTDNANTATLAQSRVVFDPLGRVWKEEQHMPDGTWSTREAKYNEQGWRKTVSELGTTGEVTTYSNYDPFGRPRTIQLPDGKQVTMLHAGVRSRTRQVRVGTESGGAAGETVSTTEIYDRLGRLSKVIEPPPLGTGANRDTAYGYDVGGRLASVTMAYPEGTQTRRFTHDMRGFLLSEQHPEKGGIGGNGTVSYSSYNARGHAERRIDGPWDVTFAYDRAERLARETETGSGLVLKEFTYGQSKTVSDRSAGKVKTVRRLNYHEGLGWLTTARETYVYGGKEGRVSRRDTVVEAPIVWSFTQSWSWNDLGLPEAITYPRCTHSGCTGVAPSRTVSPSYASGLLVGVPGFASSITYHPNGMVAQVSHTNGAHWVQENDPDGMRRPYRISISTGGALGPYSYDGAGNVTKVGGESYLYDRRSRVVRGTMGSGHRQDYGFDSFGNLTSITTTVPGGSPQPRTLATVATTNRLSAAGYDTAGNQTSWGPNTYTYTYSIYNEVRSVRGGGNEKYFAYTADGERIWEHDAAADRAIWRLRDLDGKVLREYRNNSGIWSWGKDYIYRGGQLLATVAPAPESTRHVYLDHLGTPRQIKDAAGGTVEGHHYYPFGEEISISQTGEVMRFTGHERDYNTTFGTTDDLDYMHARHCSPHTGRFLSVDPALPLERTMSSPQGWNRYAYARGNPLSRVDRDGRFDFRFTIGGKGTANCDAACAEAIRKAYAAQEQLRRSLTPAVKEFYEKAFGVDLNSLLKPGVGPTVQLAKGDPRLRDLVGDSNKGRGPLKLNLDLDLFGGGSKLFEAGLIHESAHYALKQRSFGLSLKNTFGVPVDQNTLAIREARLGELPWITEFIARGDGIEGHAAEILQFNDILTLALTEE